MGKRRNNYDDEFNNVDELLKESDPLDLDNADDELDIPRLDLNMEQVEEETSDQAKYIVERLSGYYFSEKYVNEHPYITCKISTEMQNLRRLLKMLTINEKAQDSIIMGISLNMAKSTLYQSLTSLQNSTLSIQKQLDDVVSNLEDIFKRMQEECDKTFAEKEKENDGTGKLIIKGSKEFIKEMTDRLEKRKMATANTSLPA